MFTWCFATNYESFNDPEHHDVSKYSLIKCHGHVIGNFNISFNDSMLNLTGSNTKISAGQNIKIFISAAMLRSNTVYNFSLSSNNQALLVHNILSIRTSSDNISECMVWTTNNRNPVQCNNG
eukprot:97034_1